jgi:alpha-1,3-rhamnosyl/mannosyltransferase
MCTPDTRSYARLVEVALERGASVHTYSDFVAGEVREHFGLPADRVTRIYTGIASTVGGDPARGRAVAGASRYVLALATIEPRKNLPMLVRAFDLVAGDDRDLRLAIAGPPGWGIDAFETAVAKARHREQILGLGYVDERDRRDLLAGAAVLAYPSVYEGFGHPPLEAMQCGVPVVASSAGPLPEVLGDAALLPDPADVNAIAADLARALEDEELRARLVAEGHARVARFDWSGSAEEFARLYERLAP